MSAPQPPGSTTEQATDGSWHRARCAGRAELFFEPVDAEDASARRRRERSAIALCNQCPIQAGCLDYALRHKVRFGIWGGYTARERARLVGLPPSLEDLR